MAKHKVFDENGKRVVIRMCVACRRNRPKNSLIRIAKTAEGRVAVDINGGVFGRGAYVCKNAECIEKCKKAGLLQRNLKTGVSREIYEVLCKY